MLIQIGKTEDQKTVASILIMNGYTVRIVKKKGANSRPVTYIEATKEEEPK